MREKYFSRDEIIEIKYEENKIKTVGKRTELYTSHRYHENGSVGIQMTVGQIDDELGYKLAKEKLVRQRPYPFELETGVRHRDKIERKLTETELLDISKDAMEYLLKTYPDFIFQSSFNQDAQISEMTNEKGLEYSNTDCATNVGITFKHKDSKDIMDGYFSFSLRNYDSKVFTKMADDYLANYNRMVDFPEEMIIDEQYYGILGGMVGHLHGERLALKTSLLTGKVGEKVFSDDLVVMDDVGDEECWFTDFWDGDGCTYENDKLLLIDHGTIVTGYADKRYAKKYDIPFTGGGWMNYADIPGVGTRSLRIEKSTKTIKELLDGRYAIIPLLTSGGEFNEKGDYTSPINSSLLFDGEKVIGRLKPFAAVSNMFDIFGKDFIGVGADKPIYNDKQILYRVSRSEL